MIYFSTTLLQNFVKEREFPTKTAQYWCATSPTVAMIQTFQSIATFQASRVGVRTDNIYSQFRNFSVGEGLIFMTIDCIVLMLLGFYLELVLPKTYGLRKGVCFCLSPKFLRDCLCCCGKNRRVKKRPSEDQIEMSQVAMAGQNAVSVTTERAPDESLDKIEQTFKFET